MSREERKTAEREIAREICSEVEGREDRLRLWRERTGKSERTFYSRKRELESGEFLDL
jgi:hypothetical protein